MQHVAATNLLSFSNTSTQYHRFMVYSLKFGWVFSLMQFKIEEHVYLVCLMLVTLLFNDSFQQLQNSS